MKPILQIQIEAIIRVTDSELAELAPTLYVTGMKLKAEAYNKIKALIDAANTESNEPTHCQHTLKPLTAEQLKDKWMSVSATCTKCKANFGWRCKESPDSVCHYESFKDDEVYKVELITGEMYALPHYHNPEEESSESCIFCDQPEERK